VRPRSARTELASRSASSLAPKTSIDGGAEEFALSIFEDVNGWHQHRDAPAPIVAFIPVGFAVSCSGGIPCWRHV